MTTPASDVLVQIDDRARLLATALAATDFPDREQQRRPHGVHPHARAVRRAVASQAQHPAVYSLQQLIAHGASTEALFRAAFAGDDEEQQGFATQLNDFRTASGAQALWASEEAWDSSLSDLQRAFASVQLARFFAPFVGSVSQRFVVLPNLLYPTEDEIVLRERDDLILIVPPRVAWGESPPWPYGDDPAHVCRAAVAGFGGVLVRAYLEAHPQAVEAASRTSLPLPAALTAVYTGWTEQFRLIFCASAVALFLEDTLGRREADAYLLLERRLRGLDVLPAAVGVLRRYRSEQAAGKTSGLAGVLPVFSKQLKVASRIRAL
jgi:hypothetical protein